jgi:hypothetical protein
MRNQSGFLESFARISSLVRLPELVFLFFRFAFFFLLVFLYFFGAYEKGNRRQQRKSEIHVYKNLQTGFALDRPTSILDLSFFFCYFIPQPGPEKFALLLLLAMLFVYEI